MKEDKIVINYNEVDYTEKIIKESKKRLFQEIKKSIMIIYILLFVVFYFAV